MQCVRFRFQLWPSAISQWFSRMVPKPEVSHSQRAQLRWFPTRLLHYYYSLIKHAELLIITLLFFFFCAITDAELNSDSLTEATEMEYLRKVLFEYMMGRETKVGPLFFTIIH